jgi:phosphoglycerate dehydrogenase-like enzyme
MRKVLIAPSALAELGGAYLESLRGAGFEMVYPPRTALLTEDELLKALQGVSASVAASEPYTRRVISARPDLRVIARVGVGYDAVDLAAATEHGVAVAIAPGTNHDAVAEHTFALILALAKKVVSQDKLLREGRWPRQTNLPVREQTLGIVGLGRIGKAVTLRALAFKMPVIAYEPFPDQGFVAQHGIKLMPLPQLLSQADYVSLHLPLSPETRHLIRRETLALMKPTAFLVNTARGGMVCEADLVEALRTGKLAGAGLDVFETEPTRGEHQLYQFENVVLTPHAAGGDTRSRDEMAYAAARAIVSLSRGEWPAEQIVNPEVRPKFRW